MTQEHVGIHFTTPDNTTSFTIDIPAAWCTSDWAVHRPAEHTGSRVHQLSKGWAVTCRNTGLRAWDGTNLKTAKRVAKALQATSDREGRIPKHSKPPARLLTAHQHAVQAATT